MGGGEGCRACAPGAITWTTGDCCRAGAPDGTTTTGACVRRGDSGRGETKTGGRGERIPVGDVERRPYIASGRGDDERPRKPTSGPRVACSPVADNVDTVPRVRGGWRLSPETGPLTGFHAVGCGVGSSVATEVDRVVRPVGPWTFGDEFVLRSSGFGSSFFSTSSDAGESGVVSGLGDTATVGEGDRNSMSSSPRGKEIALRTGLPSSSFFRRVTISSSSFRICPCNFSSTRAKWASLRCWSA